jgi:hypothetical protein
MIAGIGLVQVYGSPNVLSSLGLGNAEFETPLIFAVPQKPERRTLPNGYEFFVVTGQIVNPTSETQRVPDIVAELRNAKGVMIYSWVMKPSARTIAPKGTLDFNGSVVDAPKGATNFQLVFQGI